MRDPKSIDQALKALPNSIDYLVNSAGLPGSFPVEEIFKVNVLGLRYLTEKMLLRINDGGSIVNVSSGASILWPEHFDEIMTILNTTNFEDGLAACLQTIRDGSETYNFTKEIITVLTKLLSSAEWKRDVSVNSVSPGGVQTDMIPQFRESMGAIVDWSIDKVGKHASPMDIAKPILWLLSDDAAWINGADLVTDGGLLAGIQVGKFEIPES